MANGQLGDGTTTDRQEPVQVAGLASVVAIAADKAHSLALASPNWQRTAWGANSTVSRRRLRTSNA
jgi:alpha-tubulin suppressor-like RCC1 family protein